MPKSKRDKSKGVIRKSWRLQYARWLYEMSEKLLGDYEQAQLTPEVTFGMAFQWTGKTYAGFMDYVYQWEQREGILINESLKFKK